MRIFQYLNNKENSNSSNHYNNEAGFLVRDTKENNYILFDNVDDCFDYINSNKSIHLEEVISGQQRLKFDIDCYDCDQITFDEMFKEIIEAIINAFLIYWQKELNISDICICDSSGIVESKMKHSRHIIIVPYYVDNNITAAEFTNNVCKFVNFNTSKMVDKSVNKSRQNFRMIGCSKFNSDRIKKIITEHNKHDTIINVGSVPHLITNLTKLKSFECEETITNIKIIHNTDDVNQCLQHADQNHTFLRAIEIQECTILLFKRNKPSFCKLCERTHDNDNTYMIKMYSNNGMIIAYECCRRTTDKIKIAHFVSIKSGSNFNEKWAEAVSKKCISTANSWSASTTNNNTYSEAKLRNFEYCETLVVKAAMKMGKTKKLLQYIEEYCENDTIRIISFRQTFSSNIKSVFNTFKLYSDISGPIRSKRAIIQVESLHRIEISNEPPDLLILDECESIFEQFGSGLLKKFNDAFAKFMYMLKFSKRVICMDANVSDRTYNMLKLAGRNDILFHNNVYKNATMDKYHIIYTKSHWLYMLYEFVKKYKVAIPISSISDAKVLYEYLKNEYPNKKIDIYTSETDNKKKKLHFADVATYWKCDILIYTPTVSAGVSFELPHYDYIFGYFIDLSCPIETCIQMLGRIRDVKTKEYYICLAANGNNLQTDINELKRGFYENRMSVLSYDETGLIPIYNKNGQISFHETDYFNLYLENLRVKNLSKNYFIPRFINFVKEYGAQVTNFNYDDLLKFAIKQKINEPQLQKILKSIICNNKEIKYGVTLKRATEIAYSPEISEKEAIDILENENASIEMKNSYQKFHLRKVYNFTEAITPDFVETYANPKVQKMYKNRVRLKDNVKETLIKIHEDDRGTVVYNEIKDNKLEINPNTILSFNKHKIANELVNLCDFNDIYDEKYVNKSVIYNNFNRPETSELIKKSNYEFNTNYIHTNFDSTLRHINFILNDMYGFKIKLISKGVYYIQRNDYFSYEYSKTKPKL